MNTRNAICIIFISLSFLPIRLSAQPQPHIDNLKTEALAHMKGGRYGEAIDLLNNYISARPQQAEGYNLRGLAYEYRGQYEQAVYDFRSARKLEPENTDINTNLNNATREWYKLIYNEIEGYRREIVINPSLPDNYLQIGRSYKNLGEWPEAELWYDKYLTMEKASSDEIIRYTEILAKNNHLSKGEPILKKYTQENPKDHRLWSRYGYFLLWLGKTRSAVEAFEKALELKPFFKEAMDGLAKAKGEGYIYTFNDTASYKYYKYGIKGSGYAIDTYLRKLSKNPDDNDTRITLIYALLKAQRYEEAYQQLEKLKSNEKNTEIISKLTAEVLAGRENFYKRKIAEYERLLKEKPGSREILLKLAGYYSASGKFAEAVRIYQDYLAVYPDDAQIRFLYIQNAAWNGEYQLAENELDVMIAQYPDSIKYKLLSAQLYVWQNKNLGEAEKLLNYVLQKEPANFDALLAMAMLKYQQNDLTDAEQYASLAGKYKPASVEIARLRFGIQKQETLNRQNQLYSLLEKAREMIAKKDCAGALDLYKEYNNQTTPSKTILLEEADAYICAKDFNSAIDIYSRLLESQYDYDVAKKKAKTIFWNGNARVALREFEDLYARNLSDSEVRLFLGDCYMQLKEYDKARNIYNALIAEYPGSRLVRTRLGWLGEPEGSALSFNFPTYFLINPEALYYFDNYDFNFSLQGLMLESGINNYISLGISAQRGRIDSASVSNNFYTLKGHLSLKFNRVFSMGLAAGETFFESREQLLIGSVYLKAEDKEYSARIDYNSQDAAQVLYSPLLVEKRLRSDMIRLSGEYYGNSGLRASGFYSYYLITDHNQGSSLQLRIGKRFGEFAAGYEYYNLQFKDSSRLYYSPDNFESHSIWGEWFILDKSENEIKLGGKLGIIPENNYILREAFLSARILLVEHFTLQGRISLGSTVRQNTGYRSASFYITAFWTL